MGALRKTWSKIFAWFLSTFVATQRAENGKVPSCESPFDFLDQNSSSQQHTISLGKPHRTVPLTAHNPEPTTEDAASSRRIDYAVNRGGTRSRCSCFRCLPGYFRLTGFAAARIAARSISTARPMHTIRPGPLTHEGAGLTSERRPTTWSVANSPSNP